VSVGEDRTVRFWNPVTDLYLPSSVFSHLRGVFPGSSALTARRNKGTPRRKGGHGEETLDFARSSIVCRSLGTSPAKTSWRVWRPFSGRWNRGRSVQPVRQMTP